jgi:glycosyltransferase involved in cell wall biosynthesis
MNIATRDSQHRHTVMHLIDTGGPGGAETLFAQLAKHIHGGSLQPLPVVPREGWLSGYLRSLGLQPLIVPARGSVNTAYIAALVKLVRGHRAKLIHTHLLGSAVYGAVVGLITRTPVIAVLHGPTDFKSPGRFAFAKRWLLARGCSALVAVSSSTHEALVNFGLRPETITLIQNGVDTDLYSPGSAEDLRLELGLGPDDLLVAAVGNIRTPKAYEILIRCGADVLKRVPRAFFVVIGEGSESATSSLQQLIASLGLGARFKLLGFRKNTADLYRNFDVFVSSSRTEGLSLSFLEAMASGRAIVATRSGGAEEAIEPGKSGLLAPIDDPPALAAALLQVLEDRDLRARLGSAARERVTDKFSLASTVQKYEALYRRLLPD